MHAPPIVNAAGVISPNTLAVPFNVTVALLLIPPSNCTFVFALVVNEPVARVFPARLIVTVLEVLEKTNEEWPFAPKTIPLARVNVSPDTVSIWLRVLFHVIGVINIKFPIVPLTNILKIELVPPGLSTVTLGFLLVPGVKVIFPDPLKNRFVDPN